MGIEATLKTTLSSLVSGRVYPDTPPDNPTFPLIVYQQVGGAVLNPLDGSDPNEDNARIQLRVMAKTRLEANTIARSARVAMTGTLYATALGAPRWINEPDLKLYENLADYSVWFTPS